MPDDPDNSRPLLGILTLKKYIRNMLNQKPEERLKRLAEANKEIKLTLYFFCIHDVNMQKCLISGTFFDEENGRWIQRRFGYPDVFYNRGSVTKKSLAIYQQFINELREKGCRFLNHIEAFNKWEVYKLLAEDKALLPYLPETKLCKKAKNLKEMLDVHGSVYLKGCIGRKGQQVMFVRKISYGTYEYRHFVTGIKAGKVKFASLVKRVRQFFGRKNFIIQEAIRLPETNNKKIDLRAEIQRNGSGKLEIVGISVREGLAGSPITTHANSYRFTDFVEKFNFAGSNGDLDTKIREFLFRIYSKIEDGYGTLGELGIDFALDTKGKLWFIECNSQPTKVSLLKAYGEETAKQAFINPLAYARYLAH